MLSVKWQVKLHRLTECPDISALIVCPLRLWCGNESYMLLYLELPFHTEQHLTMPCILEKKKSKIYNTNLKSSYVIIGFISFFTLLNKEILKIPKILQCTLRSTIRGEGERENETILNTHNSIYVRHVSKTNVTFSHDFHIDFSSHRKLILFRHQAKIKRIRYFLVVLYFSFFSSSSFCVFL